MESTRTRNKEKKGSQLSQATTFLGGGSKASLSHSEEFLTRISAELTDEALFTAGYCMNPVPTKEKQTQDRGTQMSKHVIFTNTQGTDTCSDRNHACTKAYLLPSSHDKSSQVSVGPVKCGRLQVLRVSAHDGNGNSMKSTCPSLSCDKNKRINAVEIPGGGDIYRKNSQGKNEELCPAA